MSFRAASLPNGDKSPRHRVRFSIGLPCLWAGGYTGEIVASTPIKRVRAKNPPRKIAIFAMSTPEAKNCSTRAV
jgi:hypothetical protein